MKSKSFHIFCITFSAISLLLIVLGITTSSKIPIWISVICAPFLMIWFALLKRKKYEFHFYDYTAFLLIPLFCACYSYGTYEVFEPYAYLPIALCLGMLCTGIAYYGASLKRQIAGILVCFFIFSVSAAGILSFANVELDPNPIIPVTGTVKQKLVSSGRNRQQFLLDVQTASYGVIRMNVTYEQSRACEVGDSIELSVGKGALGSAYFYYDFIGYKDHYEWGIVFDDEDEFWQYADALPST